ncbi:hypothetical protein V2A60_003383 [Cordyceps javanica]
MRFSAVVVAFAATVLASSKTSPPPVLEGECVDVRPNPDGSWVAVGCATFTIPPGSACKLVPGNPELAYPGCCDSADCSAEETS